MEIIDSFSGLRKRLNKKKLNIYVCGPTVYDYVHIGNVRPVIIFDILINVLSLDHKVKYVHNITDVDDKIINRAIAEKKDEKEIADFYAKNYLNVLNELNISLPTHLPRVTENISYLEKFIKKLLKKSFAYKLEDGIYFSIKKWEKYDKITNFSKDKLKTNDLSRNKNKETDFVLWKFTNDNGIKFNSTFGKGRPGWHTECSALISKYFKNKTIDIHGGGVDLKFPHHINEWAQFEALNKKPLSNSWLHVGHVNFNKTKMSKSLNNVFYVKDFLSKYSTNVLKFLLISNSYSKPINVDDNTINNAKIQISKIENVLIKILWDYEIDKKDFIDKKDNEFLKAINRNLDIPNGISILNSYIKIINKNYDLDKIQKLLFILKILGIIYEVDFFSLNKLKNDKKENYQKKFKEDFLKF